MLSSLERLFPRVHATMQARPLVPVGAVVDCDLEVRMRAVARRVVRSSSRMRVLAFISRPGRLEAVRAGLTDTPTGIPLAADVLDAADRLAEVERTIKRRCHGFGDDGPLLEIRALRLYGRALRRMEARQARVTS